MDYQVLYKLMEFMSAQDKPNTKKFSNIFNMNFENKLFLYWNIY